MIRRLAYAVADAAVWAVCAVGRHWATPAGVCSECGARYRRRPPELFPACRLLTAGCIAVFAGIVFSAWLVAFAGLVLVVVDLVRVALWARRTGRW